MSLQLGIPLFLISALLQATVLSTFRAGGGQPDLVVVVVLVWAILDQGEEGMYWGFVGGLFLDLLSGVPIGLSSLILVPITFIIGLVEGQTFRRSLFLPIVLGTGGVLAYHIGLMILLRFLLGVPMAWSEVLVYVTLPSVVIDGILFVPALRLLRRQYEKMHPKKSRL